MKKVLVIAGAFVLVLLLTACTQSCGTPATINTSPIGTIGSAPAVTITSNSDGIDIAKLLTAHFDICSYDSDSTYLIEIGKTLEDNYSRIIMDMRVEISEKTLVYIYPDLEHFHKAIGRPDASEQVVGSTLKDGIYLVSPNNAQTHTYDEMMKVLVHEFSHVSVSHINSDYSTYPRWLTEGIAAYESGQIPGEIGRYGYPTLDDLSAYDQSFSDLNGYSYSYTLVSFLAEEYGWEKIRALLESYSDFDTILGVPKDEFHTLWTEYADEKFKQQ